MTRAGHAIAVSNITSPSDIRDELDRHRPLADGRGDALDRAGPDVAGGEDAGAAGLQQERLPPRRPVGRLRQRRPRSGRIPWRPVSISGGSQSVRGTAPMKLNSAGRLDRPRLSRLAVDDLDRAEVAVAATSAGPSCCRALDVGRSARSAGPGSSTCSCTGRRRGSRGSTLRGVLGEEDGGLAGGVAAADHHDLAPPAQLRLVRRRGVVDAAALEPLAPLDAQPAVVGPGGDQQALGRDRLAAVEVQHRVGVVERQAGDRRGDGQARAELVGLQRRRGRPARCR